MNKKNNNSYKKYQRILAKYCDFYSLYIISGKIKKKIMKNSERPGIFTQRNSRCSFVKV